MNWGLVMLILLLVVFFTECVMAGYQLAHMPKEEQIKAIKEWLLYAVSCAEKELGGGTGKLKLRQVYDAFAARFPWAAPHVSFKVFSVWVDEALLTMHKLIQEGGAVKTFIEGESS